MMKSLKVIGLILLACFSSIMSFAQSGKKLPNILWLSCEDIGPVLSCYGAKGVETPNIDRLASEGILFSHAYATVGVCAPSRSSIITGMYAVSIGTHNMRTGPHYAYKNPEEEKYETNNGIRDWRGRNVPQYSPVLPDGVKAFPEFLRAAGYYCTNNAKCDYQFNCPMTVWDDSSGKAHAKNKPAGAPFFAVHNFNVTHESQIWGKKDDPMLADTATVPIPAYYAEIPSVKIDVGRKYSNIMELDQQIGQLLDEYGKAGLLENTIIFFWSDHGGPLLRQKRAVGESGLHVPLIIRFPDKKMAGSINNDLVSLMDLGPTVMAMAGIETPEYMHGQDIFGKPTQKRTYIFGSADRFDESMDMSRSVLDGRYVYIKNYHPELPYLFRNNYREQIAMTRDLFKLSEEGRLEGNHGYIFSNYKALEELYDLQSDPDEVHNLALEPQHQQRMQQMRSALSAWQRSVNDLGLINEYDLYQMMWPGGIQPLTDMPVFIQQNNKLKIDSPTKGASIAYQKNEEIGTIHWQLYAQPLDVKSTDKVVARAVRIGYKTSAISHWPLK